MTLSIIWNIVWTLFWACLYYWRTYQCDKQREEIAELKLELASLDHERDERAVVRERHVQDLIREINGVRTAYNERCGELDDMQTKCEQLTLDLAAVRREAEERAKELDACKEQHAIEERRAAQWEKNYYGVREDMQKTLAHWS
jgi:chromosome segregation ATPase